ncbi:MAG: sensor histidine kinase, partial [Candidatus Binatia bacterium]
LGDWEGRAAKEALLRARSDFVAMLTHDIKNPLGAVSGYVSLLREEDPPPAEAREILARIEAANQTALLLATNFLDVSTIEASGVTISARPTDVGDLLRRILSEQRSQAETKGVDLALDARLDLPTLQADPGLLGRIFTNLIDNAIKFTPRGGAVRASARADGEGHLEVVVEDTGAGIPPDAMGRIFQRYSRASSRSDSTGLGLYIVRTFTEAHGGTVFAENRDDRLGARVGVRLPVRRAALAADSGPKGP